MSGFFILEDLGQHAVGDEVFLSEEEARHSALVRRVKKGELLGLTDGKGHTAAARVTDLKRVLLTLESLQYHEAPKPELILVQALAKAGRDELAVQAAVEMGVSRIIPWQAKRSVAVPKSTARWQRIAREAAKQSCRAWLPEVEPIMTAQPLTDYLLGSLIITLEVSGRQRLTELASNCAKASAIAVVVGPEGGITPEELSLLAPAGQVCRLGDTVLRTGTAGPAAIAIINTFLGRW